MVCVSDGTNAVCNSEAIHGHGKVCKQYWFCCYETELTIRLSLLSTTDRLLNVLSLSYHLMGHYKYDGL